MNLPIVNAFSPPYEVWFERDPSLQEMFDYHQKNGFLLGKVKVELEAIIDSHFKAAEHMLMRGVDNALGNHIRNYLDIDSNFLHWKMNMPSQTPKALADYQRNYPNCDFEKVDEEINALQINLSEGQYLYHGGIFPETPDFMTVRPFSTSFCPQVALRNAEWCGKAYNDERIDLLVLRVVNPKTNIFLYKQKGTSLGHEEEVLFASGAQLTLQNRTLIRKDYRVREYMKPEKLIPVYVVEVDIS